MSSINAPSQKPVPMGTVLLVTMVWWCLRFWAIDTATPRMAVVSALPSEPGGVPTQTKTTSELSMASQKSSVKRNVPAARPPASSPASWNGARPERNSISFSASDSTPMTSWPTWERHAATTDPT